MKIQKNKIIVGSVVGMVVLFMIFYSIAMFGGDSDDKEIKQSFVPKLEQEEEIYTNRLKAIDAIEEERTRFIPTVYDDDKFDEQGVYIENKEELDKQKVIDSIFQNGKIKYNNPTTNKKIKKGGGSTRTAKRRFANTVVDVGDIKKEQNNFFKANNNSNKGSQILGDTDDFIYAEVNGDQIIKINERLKMRLTRDAKINGFIFKKNTYVFGIAKFRPNRIVVTITSINNKPVNIEAYDVQDGGLGIYVKNSLTAETTSELGNDLTREVDEEIPGVQTIKRIFRKKVKNIKVTVINKYQLHLKLKK